MLFLHLTLLYCMLSFPFGDPTVQTQNARRKISKSIAANLTATDHVEPGATDIIFQSKDAGQTWQDISYSLPGNEQPEGFFAGGSDLYLYGKNGMYRSKGGLETPVWEKENVLDPRCTSIAFNRSGVMAYNYEGQLYKKLAAALTWSPVYGNLKKDSMRNVFEASNGTIFVGRDSGLYKSADRGRSWKQVQNEGWVMDFVESEGVLIATGQNGIMRSTDNGETWEWVISEGGAGIAIERIDGRFAAIAYSSSTISRRIHISMDRGKTWKAIDEGLRPSLSISSIKQMGTYLICGHPDGIFRSSDLGKTWELVHTSIDPAVRQSEGKVFEIYVSGDVLYAVLKDSGC